MTKTFIAASILALSLAVPAFAAEEYQAGPARAITAETPTHDVGAAQYPAFDGAYDMTAPRSVLLLGNANSATVEPLNSAPVGALTGVATANSAR